MKTIRKVLFLSFNFPPDKSQGAKRTDLILKKMLSFNEDIQITLITSKPRRYGIQKIENNSYKYSNQKTKFKIIRIWIPYLGDGFLGSSLSYFFYGIQAIPVSLYLNPDIVYGTSAKLLTSFITVLVGKLLDKKTFLDIRDTFTANFFYFYKNDWKILFYPIFRLIEIYTLNSAYSINLISPGFKEILKKNRINTFTKPEKFTGFTNGLSKDLGKEIIKSCSGKKPKKNAFTVTYLGNLGKGQGLYQLIKNIIKNKNILDKMKEQNIFYEIYGGGYESSLIKKIIEKELFSPYKGLIKYKGIIDHDQILKVYSRTNGLMLQLSDFYPLSAVLPSKIFEYCATNHPIVFAAKGFTHSFIEKIEGTIAYETYDEVSFINALMKAKNFKVNYVNRKNFIEKYNAEKIYKEYCKNILYT